MSPADLLRSVEEYLALRRALGFKLRHETWFLPNFVAFLAEHGSTVITTELAVRWAQLPTGTTLGWLAHRLSSVRSFAKHRRAFDPRTEVPPPDIITYRAHRRTPHLYTTPEIATLLLLASNLSGPMRSTAYSALIGLLASTGMRAGEALGLERCEQCRGGDPIAVLCEPLDCFVRGTTEQAKLELIPVVPLVSPKLTEALVRRELPVRVIEKVVGENFRRFFGEVL